MMEKEREEIALEAVVEEQLLRQKFVTLIASILVNSIIEKYEKGHKILKDFDGQTKQF
jgi:hypothetical protein